MICAISASGKARLRKRDLNIPGRILEKWTLSHFSTKTYIRFRGTWALIFFSFLAVFGAISEKQKTFKASTVKITTVFSHGAGVVTFGQICVTFPAAFCDIWISFWQKISNFRTVFLQKMMFPPLFLTTIIEVYALVSGWNDDTRSIYTGRDPCR